jgi:membrane-bound serine protease (ClpP class)
VEENTMKRRFAAWREAVGGTRPKIALGSCLLVLLALAAPLAAQDPQAVDSETTELVKAPKTRVVAAVIPIRGMIDDIMRKSIERRLEDAQAGGASVIIFEMDTLGGLVTSALDIFQIIERYPGRTVAWVNPKAYSAGALISVACDEIWMSPSSAIGDCAPIVMGMSEMGETERAKAESPILQRFRNAAAEKGYDQTLSRAMVTIGEEVWWLERADDSGVREFVNGDEKQRRIDDVEEGQREWRLVENFTTDAGIEYPVKQPIVGDSELLTMSHAEAVAYGFARGIAASPQELLAKMDLAVGGPPMQLEQSGWEKFASWLNSPMIRGILLVIVLIGAYMEFQSPGLIVPGATALIALAVFLAAPYADGLATLWPLLLFGLGAILLAIEIFLIPGFGVAGLLGIAAMILAVFVSFVPPDIDVQPLELPSLEPLQRGFMTGLKVLTVSIAVSLAGIFLLVRYLPESRLARGIVGPNPKADALALADVHPELAQVGDVGVVTGALRPGGQARFGQEIVDVSSQGEYVEAGRRVQVIRRQGRRIVVRPLPEESQA